MDWAECLSVVLDAEGGVWEAGHSRYTDSFHTFQRVTGLPPITLVAAGISHTAALDTEGGLWVWSGLSESSWASSLPQQVQSLPPLLKVASGDNFLLAEAEEGTLWILGSNTRGALLGTFQSFSESTTSLPWPQLLVDVVTLSLWMKMAVSGPGEKVNWDNWGRGTL